MKEKDLRLLGNSCFGLFGVLVLFGVIAYFYQEENGGWGVFVTYPYRNYALPLIVLGFCFLVIAFVASHSTEE